MADPTNPKGELPHNPVPEADLTEAYSIPAPVINRMISSNTPSGMRLTFLEQNVVGLIVPRARGAIFLSYQDALSLRDLITTQLERAKRGGFYVPAPIADKQGA